MITNKHIFLATIVMGFVAAGLAFAYFLGSPADPYLLKPSDQKIITMGRVVYQEHCAACHGDNLEGEPNWQMPDEDGYLPAPPHDETGHTWHHPDEDLIGFTKYGLIAYANLTNHKSNMPAYEGVLSDEEIIAVLSFIKSTWPDEVKQMHDYRNALAKSR